VILLKYFNFVFTLVVNKYMLQAKIYNTILSPLRNNIRKLLFPKSKPYHKQGQQLVNLEKLP